MADQLVDEDIYF